QVLHHIDMVEVTEIRPQFNLDVQEEPPELIPVSSTEPISIPFGNNENPEVYTFCPFCTLRWFGISFTIANCGSVVFPQTNEPKTLVVSRVTETRVSGCNNDCMVLK